MRPTKKPKTKCTQESVFLGRGGKCPGQMTEDAVASRRSCDPGEVILGQWDSYGRMSHIQLLRILEIRPRDYSNYGPAMKDPWAIGGGAHADHPYDILCGAKCLGDGEQEPGDGPWRREAKRSTSPPWEAKEQDHKELWDKGGSQSEGKTLLLLNNAVSHGRMPCL